MILQKLTPLQIESLHRPLHRVPVSCKCCVVLVPAASNNILSAGNWQHSCMFLPAAGPCCKCFTSQSPYPVTHLNQRLPLPPASASTCILLSAAHILLFCLASRSRLIAPDLVHAVRWAKRVYDPVIVPSKPPPHRIMPYLSPASIFLRCLLASCILLVVTCVVHMYLPTYPARPGRIPI